MNTITNDFDNLVCINQRSENKLIIGNSGLILRYVTSVILFVVILLVNNIFDFTYTPIFILMAIQVTFLLLGVLFFGFSTQKISEQITDKKIRKLLLASNVLQFLMVGLIIVTISTLAAVYQIPAVNATIPNSILNKKEWYIFLLFDFQMLLELPMFSISLLLFGLALKEGYKKNYWNTKFPKSIAFLLVFSIIFTIVYILNVIELYHFGTIFYLENNLEERILWLYLLDGFHEYSYHLSTPIYGSMGLITMIEITYRMKKCYLIPHKS